MFKENNLIYQHAGEIPGPGRKPQTPTEKEKAGSPDDGKTDIADRFSENDGKADIADQLSGHMTKALPKDPGPAMKSSTPAGPQNPSTPNAPTQPADLPAAAPEAPSLLTSPADLVKICRHLNLVKDESDPEITPEKLQNALRFYALGSHDKAKESKETKRILDLLSQIDFSQANIKIDFLGGTDGTEHRLHKEKAWHTAKAKALKQLLAFMAAHKLKGSGGNFEPTEPQTRALIDKYIAAVAEDKGYEFVKDNQKEFLPAGTIFDAAQAVQRAENMKNRLLKDDEGFLILEEDKDDNKAYTLMNNEQGLILILGSTVKKEQERKSGLVFTLVAATAAPAAAGKQAAPDAAPAKKQPTAPAIDPAAAPGAAADRAAAPAEPAAAPAGEPAAGEPAAAPAASAAGAAPAGAATVGAAPVARAAEPPAAPPAAPADPAAAPAAPPAGEPAADPAAAQAVPRPTPTPELPTATPSESPQAFQVPYKLDAKLNGEHWIFIDGKILEIEGHRIKEVDNPKIINVQFNGKVYFIENGIDRKLPVIAGKIIYKITDNGTEREIIDCSDVENVNGKLTGRVRLKPEADDGEAGYYENWFPVIKGQLITKVENKNIIYCSHIHVIDNKLNGRFVFEGTNQSTDGGYDNEYGALPVIDGQIISALNDSKYHIIKTREVENINGLLNGRIEVKEIAKGDLDNYSRLLPVVAGKLITEISGHKINRLQPDFKITNGKLNGWVELTNPPYKAEISTDEGGGPYYPVVNGELITSIGDYDIVGMKGDFSPGDLIDGHINGFAYVKKKSDTTNTILELPVIAGQVISSIGRNIDAAALSDNGIEIEIINGGLYGIVNTGETNNIIINTKIVENFDGYKLKELDVKEVINDSLYGHCKTEDDKEALIVNSKLIFEIEVDGTKCPIIYPSLATFSNGHYTCRIDVPVGDGTVEKTVLDGKIIGVTNPGPLRFTKKIDTATNGSKDYDQYDISMQTKEGEKKYTLTVPKGFSVKHSNFDEIHIFEGNGKEIYESLHYNDERIVDLRISIGRDGYRQATYSLLDNESIIPTATKPTPGYIVFKTEPDKNKPLKEGYFEINGNRITVTRPNQTPKTYTFIGPDPNGPGSPRVRFFAHDGALRIGLYEKDREGYYGYVPSLSFNLDFQDYTPAPRIEKFVHDKDSKLTSLEVDLDSNLGILQISNKKDMVKNKISILEPRLSTEFQRTITFDPNLTEDQLATIYKQFDWLKEYSEMIDLYDHRKELRLHIGKTGTGNPVEYYDDKGPAIYIDLMFENAKIEEALSKKSPAIRFNLLQAYLQKEYKIKHLALFENGSYDANFDDQLDKVRDAFGKIDPARRDRLNKFHVVLKGNDYFKNWDEGHSEDDDGPFIVLDPFETEDDIADDIRDAVDHE